MTADAAGVALDEAWGRIPQTRETTGGFGSFTRQRIERVISLVIGLGCLVLGTQSFINALAPSEEIAGWHLPLMILAFVPLAVMLVACAIGRGVRLFAALYPISYCLVLLLWPAATAGVPVTSPTEPWIWYLVNVATVAAILGYPLPWQIAWTVLVPLLFGAVRLLQAGVVDVAFDVWFTIALDVSFALILGGVLVTLGWVFRSVASNVDEARALAVSSYARAAAADAAEQERVAVAALMHDSVLAALIAVERAHTPRERALASTMAREALTRLANTEHGSEEGTDDPKDAAVIVAEIEHGAAELGLDLSVAHDLDPATGALPGRVARALSLAATQAIANSVQHADAAGLTVEVSSSANPTKLRIDVRDTGKGFDMERVPDDRLGIRGSIIARVGAVGGTASISSGPSGTSVRLEWPGEDLA
ncbi:sensor histidine kinase [Microbacterium sp.]|uniref:sensor histidine kinase n=1 Tax=Microbacterium sp. TaxID=51671 RepID=UPI002C0ACB18|nr:ATP-binding protein [Microbacterium sp.]HWL76302.1 ATP-binding protein [Microbacterium sp.]